MKTWLRWALAAGVMVAMLPALALLLALERAPAVAQINAVDIHDVGHVLAVVRRHDPRRMFPGQPVQARVTERDVELLLNHAAHRMLGVRVRLTLQSGEARLVASQPWALAGLSGWVNVRATWHQSAKLPELQSWRIGQLPLPTALARPLLKAVAARLPTPVELALVDEVVQQVRFDQDEMTVAYVWRGDTSKRLLASLTPPLEQQRLRVYADLLTHVTGGHGVRPVIELPRLVGPLFELARLRSIDNDPALENRAAILTLALYVTGRDLGAVVPAARAWAQPRRLQVVLNGREDFPQHFLVSALLAVESTSPLTHAVGLYKEVSDANGGSGFSFNDLAANRAGQRFGRLAFEQPLRLQALLARGVEERSLMPDVADLPEYLSQAEFTRRYQRIGSANYNRLLDDIERRVGALPLYR